MKGIRERIKSAGRPNTTRRSLAAALLSASLAPHTWALDTAHPILIQFSHVVTEDAPKGKAALRFKALAEARSGGRVRVEVYPDSRLYKDREELDALRLGAVQMLAPSLSKLSAIGAGDFEVFDLPFLFKDHADFRATVEGPIGTQLLRKLDAKGIRGLAYWDNGFKVFTANRPLRDPADFQGLRMRVQASKTLVAQMKTLGVQVSVSPLTAVHEMLRRGELDGQENVPSNILGQRLHEFQSHLTLSKHGYLAYVVLVNKPFWDRLPADIRAVLEQAMKEATAYANQISEEENRQALARIQASGQMTFHPLSRAETTRWRQAMGPTYDLSRQWISADTLDAVMRRSQSPP